MALLEERLREALVELRFSGELTRDLVVSREEEIIPERELDLVARDEGE
jgi:hypothetical protein